MGNGSSDFNSGWWIVLGGGNALIMGANTGGGITGVNAVLSSLTAPAGEWSMVTFVRTSITTILIYVNGVLDTSTVGSFANPVSSTNDLTFGTYALDLPNYVLPLDGDIGVVRVYSTNLTTGAISNLYANGTNGLVR